MPYVARFVHLGRALTCVHALSVHGTPLSQNQVLIRNRTADSAVCGEDKFYLTFQDAPPANTSRFPCTTPCVDPKDQSACATLGGGAYAANAIVGCYCKQALQQYMSGV